VVRHVVLFRFAPDTSDAAKQSVRDGLAALKRSIAAIQRYEFGDDLHLVDGNFDFAVVAGFANIADYRSYAADPLHLQLVRERIAPILAERAAVQFVL